ncbi:aldehyde dehydrogenase family 3 member F1-like protein [Tanacetum coccineum]|uniref:Aldehyde dehydrogenase family 3 member F1-like protein n=1 Tax=Tanacetum coccineum TaxID=301880 RepID=A0ABQ5DGP9_9ASTR
MTRSTIKKLVEPLKEPEREMHRLRKAVRRQQQNESLAIAWRNLFDGEASSSISYELKITAPTKILREFSSPNSSGFQNPIVYPVEQIGKVLDSQDVWLIQGRAKQWLDRIPPGQISTWEQLVSKFLDNIFPPGHTSTFKDKIIRLLQGNEEPFKDVWIRFQDLIRQASHHGDDAWEEPPPIMNISSISKIIKPTFKGRLRAVHEKLSYLTTPTGGKILRNPYLIATFLGAHMKLMNVTLKNHTNRCACLEETSLKIPSFMILSNNDSPPRGNTMKRIDGEEGPIRGWRRNVTRDPSTNISCCRSRITTRDLPYPNQLNPTLIMNNETTDEGEVPSEKENPNTLNYDHPQSSTLYHPSKSFSFPYPSRLKKKKKDDEDEKFLSISRHIHINLPFLEALLHMPKEAKVLNDLLSHNAKLENSASSVKLSEECSIAIQKNLPQKEGDPRSFTLPCLIGPLSVKNALEMDDPNITIEEYTKLEEEKSRRRGKVYNWETATSGKIWCDEDVHDLRSVETEFPDIFYNDAISFDESDDDDYTVIYDKNPFSYKIISIDDLKTDSKNDNDKVNMPSFPSSEPTVSYFDDFDYFKDFEKEFPVISYNDALTSKLDFSERTEPSKDDVGGVFSGI